MRVIEFDGNGKPSEPHIQTGTVLLLVQDDNISVVRVELLPPDQFGPCFEHAVNQDVLEAEARGAFERAFPNRLPRDRHWVLECPLELADRARF